jgi:hypothetical protein
MLFGGDDHRVVNLAEWVASLDELVGWVGRQFARAEPRVRVRAYVRGLLAGLERKNGWTLAEHAGAVSPDGMQRLLRTADPVNRALKRTSPWRHAVIRLRRCRIGCNSAGLRLHSPSWVAALSSQAVSTRTYAPSVASERCRVWWAMARSVAPRRWA